MNLFYYAIVWIHLLSMAGLFGLLLSCKLLSAHSVIVMKLSQSCRTFFGLLFVSGFIGFYLKITNALEGAGKIDTGLYHIVLTKFILLMGLGHFVFVGSKKNQKNWIDFSIAFLLLASFLGVLLRRY